MSEYPAYNKSWEAPHELQFVDGARLNCQQINELSRLRHLCGGDLVAACAMFRENHRLIKRDCCFKKWIEMEVD